MICGSAAQSYSCLLFSSENAAAFQIGKYVSNITFTHKLLESLL